MRTTCFSGLRVSRSAAVGQGAWLLAACLAAAVQAQPAAPSGATSAPAQIVYTRAVVRGLPDGSGPAMVHLKIAPRGKLPFSTLAFRVERLELLQGLQLGDEVGFTAERGPQGNTLTRIVKVAPCVRFQTCPPIVGDGP